MARPTLTAQVDALTAQVSALTDLVGTLAEVVTASVTAPTPKAETVVGPVSRSRDGRDFECTAPDACGRKLRSAKRASIHGIELGGHAKF